jgi:TonB family protein
MPTTLKCFSYSFLVHAFIGMVAVLLIPKHSDFLEVERKMISVSLNAISFGKAGNRNAFLPEKIEKPANRVTKHSIQNQELPATHNSQVAQSVQVNQSSVKSSDGHLNGGGGSDASLEFNHTIQSYADPVYPRLALKRGIVGVVKVKISVSADGVPSQILVIKTSGHKILDDAAMEAIKKWTFTKKNNLTYFVEKTIVFEIRS